jgi:hypothetical protein
MKKHLLPGDLVEHEESNVLGLVIDSCKIYQDNDQLFFNVWSEGSIKKWFRCKTKEVKNANEKNRSSKTI